MKDLKDVLARVDHTLLGITATSEDYIKLCEEGLKFNTASVCVPPSRVKLCADYTKGKIPICTVIGFPNGYQDSETKAFESKLAIKQGAAEIDMVIDIGKVKEYDYNSVLQDIVHVRLATDGYILKIIIETAVLTQDEKIELCKIVNESGADYIKTSTGFSTAGATAADIELLRKYSSSHVKVKAAGGISTIEDAKLFIDLGADRLGTSRIVKLAEGLEANGY